MMKTTAKILAMAYQPASAQLTGQQVMEKVYNNPSGEDTQGRLTMTLTNNRGTFSNRSFTFIDYGRIDSGLATNGKSVGAICCIDYLNDWVKLSKEEYEKKKEEVAQLFVDRLEKILPGIQSQIEYYEVGTSVAVKRYTLNPGGAVYGFAQTPNKHIIDLSLVPDNLHFASAWGKTGGGFSGAIYSGYLCAYNLLRLRR